jgi:hypothetical protein
MLSPVIANVIAPGHKMILGAALQVIDGAMNATTTMYQDHLIGDVCWLKVRKFCIIALIGWVAPSLARVSCMALSS